MKTGLIVGDVVSIEQINNSVYGNPRFNVTLTEDGTERTRTTMSDASCSYDFLSNIRAGDVVVITVTRAGRIRTAVKTTRIATR